MFTQAACNNDFLFMVAITGTVCVTVGVISIQIIIDRDAWLTPCLLTEVHRNCMNIYDLLLYCIHGMYFKSDCKQTPSTTKE